MATASITLKQKRFQLNFCMFGTTNNWITYAEFHAFEWDDTSYTNLIKSQIPDHVAHLMGIAFISFILLFYQLTGVKAAYISTKGILMDSIVNTN